jgi:uncharacterized protein (DUF2141 family)
MKLNAIHIAHSWPDRGDPVLASRRTRHLDVLLAGVLASACASVSGADLTFPVDGFVEPLGQIGRALFSSSAAASFPMDNGKARVQWVRAQPKAVGCHFDEVTEGRYAVAVSHDVNANRKLDTNIFGIPVEQWGVSNHVRPRLRAPRFDEVAFQLTGEPKEVVMDVKVAK